MAKAAKAVAQPKTPKNLFQPGHEKKGGRKIGSGNHVTRVLKEAIMIAAEMEGSDCCGTGKLIGYLRRVARDDSRTFCMLLGRLIPVQENNQTDVRVEVTYRSVEEISRELESRGIDIRLLNPPEIDNEEEFEDALEDANQD